VQNLEKKLAFFLEYFGQQFYSVIVPGKVHKIVEGA